MRSMMATMALTLAATLCAHASEPERTVAGHTVISTHDPAIRINLPATSQYVGADRWLLIGYDDAEMHVFVDADAARNIQRLYWVQFEAYLPSHPEAHHDYSASRHITINGLDFHLDTWVQGPNTPVEKDSDSEHERHLLATKHYKRPPNAMYVRLVYLPDADQRKELMVIYGEDLTPTGFTAAQLSEHGAAHDRWLEMEKGLIERAVQRVSFVR